MAMRSERIGRKQCGVVTLDGSRAGIKLFISYGTIIGFQMPGTSPLYTDRRFSVTTTRHKMALGLPYEGFEMSAYWFESACPRWTGQSAARDAAPVSFAEVR